MSQSDSSWQGQGNGHKRRRLDVSEQDDEHGTAAPLYTTSSVGDNTHDVVDHTLADQTMEPSQVEPSSFITPEMAALYNDESIQEFAQNILDQQHLSSEEIAEMAMSRRGMRYFQNIPGIQFSMMEALNDNPDIMLLLVGHLNIPTLLSLYAIDKRFHYLFNCNYVAYIKACLRRWAPEAAQIFPWHCYKHLCIKDPMPRIKSRHTERQHEAETNLHIRRDVPSLRWLQMVIYREGVSKDILIQLALMNLRCPPGTSDALKRMWFMLDLPLNTHRIALVHSEAYITEDTLTRLTCFVLKLDMAFSDPLGAIWPFGHPNQRFFSDDWAGGTFVGTVLRKCLLGERSLTPLWRVLHGWSPDPRDPQIPISQLDMLRLHVRHRWKKPDDLAGAMQRMSVLGVPWNEIGTQCLERHVISAGPRIRRPMVNPDQLVMFECIRRQLSMHRKWPILMTYGLRDRFGELHPELTEQEMNARLMALHGPR